MSSRMVPFVVSMRTRYILGAGCDHSESWGSCSALERFSGANVCQAAASSVANAMKTDKGANRVVSDTSPLTPLIGDDSQLVSDGLCYRSGSSCDEHLF